MSTVASPIRCDACTLEQHRRLPFWPFLAFAFAFFLTGFSAVVLQEIFAPLGLVGLMAFLPLLALAVGWEAFLFRRGEMVATVRWRKRVAQVVLFAPFAVALAGFAFLIFRAAP